VKDTLILAVETSCDETSASVVMNGRTVLSNIIATQVKLHAEYGGVVPEIASRKHVESVIPVIDMALKEAGVAFADVDAIAVTYGPGLVGALLVGISAAKALSFALGKPLIAVNHIDGHICANASGGHSHIDHMLDYKKPVVLGRTRDDAAGEAFDKIARVLGLGYPGGPAVERNAAGGDMDAFRFPRVKFQDSPVDFSFSGLKTAVINVVNGYRQKGESLPVKDICASFQKAVVDVLVGNTINAALQMKSDIVCLAGGVAANTYLRESFMNACGERNIRLFFPPLQLCTDNAAMIASAAYYSYVVGEFADGSLNAVPGLKLGEK